MSVLIDTNVLVRLANTLERDHAKAVRAVAELRLGGELLHVTPQNLIEFRNAATRPAAANGLGMTAAEAETHAAVFEAGFTLLAETPAIYPAWKSLVTALAVIGKQVHDARFVAVCHVHRVTHFLTFNTGHFTRFASYGPGLVILHPATV